jgi:RNA polymerase sigma-70 factor (ECF subfamily)
MKASMDGLIWEHREEADIVSLARCGDLVAFDALVARYRPAALVVARQILHRLDAAEDAVQDSFLAVYKSLPQLADPDKFAAWLGSIVRHRARRLAAGERATQLPLDNLILCHSPSLTEELERRAGSNAIRCALQDLPEDVGPIMDLYYLKDWSVRQISQFLALPDSTVKWRLHTGRKLLRTSLSEQLEESNESGK